MNKHYCEKELIGYIAILFIHEIVVQRGA